MGVLYSRKGRSKKGSSGCFVGKQEGFQGQWQQASLFREVLEQVTRNADTGYRRDMETATTERRSTVVGGVRCVEAYTNGEHTTGYCWCSSVPTPTKQKCSERTHLIHALKLLANQQEDGDSPIQSIVTGQHERSRKGIMDGLRSFIDVDNHSALDEGHVRKAQRPFKVQRPKFSEDFSDVLREGADVVTLRAEEVDTLKACINVDHIEENRWRALLVDANWHAFLSSLNRRKGMGRAVLSSQRDE